MIHYLGKIVSAPAAVHSEHEAVLRAKATHSWLAWDNGDPDGDKFTVISSEGKIVAEARSIEEASVVVVKMMNVERINQVLDADEG